MSLLHILQIYSGQEVATGDFVYRIQQPAEGLAALPDVQVETVDLLELSDLEPLRRWPFLILHHVTDPDVLPVVAARRKRGLPTVYEVADHFLASQAHRPETRRSGPPDYYHTMLALIRWCDAVQTTGPLLKQRYQHLNPNVWVFPNLISEVRSRPSEHGSESGVTVGWGGSARHLPDLESVAEPLKRWLRTRPDVRLEMMGSRRVRALFEDLPAQRFQWHPPGSLQDYLAFLDRLDVGLAPLRATEFNAGRSDVKYLEMASREVAPVCSRFGPYQEVGREGESILRFDDAAEVLRHLERLRTHPEARRRLARNARQWVTENRLATPERWHRRLAAYRTLAGRVAAGTPPPPLSRNRQVRDLLARCASRPGDSGIGLELERALARWPNHYQLHYFYGWHLAQGRRYAEAEGVLQRALILAPTSLRSALLLARVRLLQGRWSQALEALDAALRVAPGFPLTLVLKGVALQTLGCPGAALEVLQACVGLEPVLVEAEAVFARVARILGREEAAQRALERIRTVAPDAPEVL